MATVLLSTALSSAGPVAALAGAYAGSWIDTLQVSALTPWQSTNAQLESLAVSGHDEGSFLPRIYGNYRVEGKLIWATDFIHRVQHSGSIGASKGSGPEPNTRESTNIYFANFAVALCEGEITGIGRIWLDDNLITENDANYRTYYGSEEQVADPLIEAKEVDAPAYRGVAYIVFEELLLQRYGDRLPRVEIEVYRAISSLEQKIKSVAMIPGSGEFFCGTTPVYQNAGYGNIQYENLHQDADKSNIEKSLDQLISVCPNIENVSLVISWFGDDLRAEECRIYPAVEEKNKFTSPYEWSVGNTTREDAVAVSRDSESRAAYGGTPADLAVIEAIRAIKSRGLKVTLLPFLLMDIPAESTKSSPYGGTQDAYPWRGLITCDPAPGFSDSPDNSNIAQQQVLAFFGNASASDFTINNNIVNFAGESQDSWSKMVLHYAHLTTIAGGVDAFIIGTEFVGLTKVRGTSGNYPAVDALITIAQEVKQILPDTAITYASDWSEYGSYSLPNTEGDIDFPLDKLWSNSAIEAIGIDAYFPLSDWRHDSDAPDRANGWDSEHDIDYLQHNLSSGENWDWYYASEADRINQVRTPISDGAYGKNWVFRSKDIAGWWSNLHTKRINGVETEVTSWIPYSKPIWFTEAGCPAIDGGARTPWRFYDPKSSSSGHPPFSDLAQDNLIQRAYLTALFGSYDPASENYDTTVNPVSPINNMAMIDTAHISLWAWDARPYPAFPKRTEIWSDGSSYERGHWLNGRLGKFTLSDLISHILQDANAATNAIVENNKLNNRIFTGYAINQLGSIRSHISQLVQLFSLITKELEGKLIISTQSKSATIQLSASDVLLSSANNQAFTFQYPENSDLTSTLRFGFINSENSYQNSAVLVGEPLRANNDTDSIAMPLVMQRHEASAIARSYLSLNKQNSISVRFTLGPNQLALDVGDVVEISLAGDQSGIQLTDQGAELFSITKASGLLTRDIEALLLKSPWRDNISGLPQSEFVENSYIAPPIDLFILDLPQISTQVEPWQPLAAARSNNWPTSGVSLYRENSSGEFNKISEFVASATFGRLITSLPAGNFASRSLPKQSITIEFFGQTPSSTTLDALLAGENALAIKANNDQWEIVQFLNATAIDSQIYQLEYLFRGQNGTDPAMLAGASIGNDVIVLDSSVITVPIGLDEREIELSLSAVPNGTDITSFQAANKTHIAAALGLRPKRVASLKAWWYNQNLYGKWKRRARFGGDSWIGEVPLEDDREEYLLEIKAQYSNNPTEFETIMQENLMINNSTPEFTYSREYLTRLLDSEAINLKIIIQQVGTLYGAGVENSVIIEWL